MKFHLKLLNFFILSLYSISLTSCAFFIQNAKNIKNDIKIINIGKLTDSSDKNILEKINSLNNTNFVLEKSKFENKNSNSVVFSYEGYANKITITFYISSNDILKFHVIDVGQGSSMLVELSDNKLFLLDSGEDTKKLTSFMTNFFTTNTQYNDTIDYFLTSHCDEDHIAGAKWIYDTYNIKYSYVPPIESSKIEGDEIDKDGYTPYDKKDTIIYSKYITSVLSEPNSTWEFTSKDDEDDLNNITQNYTIKIFDDNKKWGSNWNNYSPIVFFSFNGKTVCISSDAEKVKEERIVDEFDLPETDVYIMGHHGSSTSSSEKFLEEIKPKYSLFSSEDPKGSKYGFPSLAALKRVNEYSHGEIYGTEKNGDINFLIDENGQIDFENSNLIKTTQGWTKKNGILENI